MELRRKIYWVNNTFLQVQEAGPPEGKILLFLHGFPEGSLAWQKQIPYFASKGYRVVVPDQRGYNKSGKPVGIKAYRMQNLMTDIAELIGQLGQQKVVVTGHDWGGAVAWAMAIHYPHLLEKLIILNLPHPQVLRDGFKNWPKQILKSWYIGFFQLPLLPELACKAADFKLLERSMLRSSRPGTFPPESMLEYKEAWRQPAAIRSMIHWYRAVRHSSPAMASMVDIPTLLIWGKKDLFLSHEMARPSIEKCRNGRLIMMEDATHWLQHEKSAEVNRMIEEFVKEIEE